MDLTFLPSNRTVPEAVHFPRTVPPLANELERYHRKLQRGIDEFLLNERFLEQRWTELQEIPLHRGRIYWLTTARLAELALLCAGNYADNLETQAAGDLLVNPRTICIHVRGKHAPLKKERHISLTEQFAIPKAPPCETIEWFKTQTCLEIKKKALLPSCYDALKRSGYFSLAYLDSFDRRMKRVAEVIGFLAAWQVIGSAEFCARMQALSSTQREFIESNLCRFDRRIFDEIGSDIQRMMEKKACRSRFIAVGLT